MALKSYEVKFKIECEWFTDTAAMIKSKDYSSGVLSARIRKLEDHYKNLSVAYENLLTKLDEETDQARVSVYDEQFKKANLCYNELEAFSVKLPNSDGSHMTTESSVHGRLPNIDLQNYHGEPFEWFGFISLFNSLILSRNDLSKTQKYHYLFSHVYDEPRTLIQHLTMTDDSLDTALEILKSRYDNKRMMIDRYLGRLINLPVLTNPRNLRVGLLNPLLECTRSLKNLGLSIEDYMLVFMMLGKLPTELRTRFEQKHGGLNNGLPEFKIFITFIQNECHFIDTATDYNSVTVKSDERTRKLNTYEQRKQPVGCLFCNNTNHKVFDCFKFLGSTPDERRTWVKTKGYCFRCFGGHSAISCTRNVACSFCGNVGHHKLICLTQNDKFNKNNKINKNTRHVAVGMFDYNGERNTDCNDDYDHFDNRSVDRFENNAPHSAYGRFETNREYSCRFDSNDNRLTAPAPAIQDVRENNDIRFSTSPTAGQNRNS
ncbi:uncharacterized protein LOC134654619 [Cydia amplana]|uniref:uncharacterized protein LOC134654619 n=1 Tax=Cydia amplana TaxID=1869771 RepID=UPI002FE66170